MRSASYSARSLSISGYKRHALSCRNAWDQLDDAINATRYGLFFSTRAAAAPRSKHRAGEGEGLAKGIEIAKRIAGNSQVSNFAIMNVLPRIAESDPASGSLSESLMAAVASSSDEAKARLKDFLEKRGKKVLRG